VAARGAGRPHGARVDPLLQRRVPATAPHVRIAYVVPPAETPRIVYPAALITTGGQRAAAGRFLQYLQGPAAAAMFRRAGFVPLAGRVTPR